MNQEERRIVLLGKTGVGKSATGNTILGRNAFRSEPSLDSVTKHSERAEAVIGGKLTCVVDTPGLFDTALSQNPLAEELCRSVYLSQPVVHAFILVFKYERFTEQEKEMIKRLHEVFGEKVTDHMIILFTHAEGVREKEEINRSRNENLRRVLDQCGGRFQLFNNNAEPQNRQQVTELLQKIDRMVQQNGGRFYTNEVFEEAKSSTWEKFWEKHRPMFCIVVRSLKITERVEYVVLGNRRTEGLMSLWCRGMIKVESNWTWKMVSNGNLPATNVAAAGVAAGGRSRMLQ